MKTKVTVGAALAIALVLAPGFAAYADDTTEPPVSAPLTTEEAAPAVEPPVVEEAPVSEATVPAEEVAPPVEEAAPPVEEAPAPAPEEVSTLTTEAQVEVDPTPYVLVGWYIEDPENIWEPDQVILDRDLFTVDLSVGDLSALDEVIASQCGYFQVDLYNDSQVTRDLIEGGVLRGPNDPQEDLAYGAVEGNPWTYVTGYNCVPPPTNKECVDYSDGGVSTNLWRNGWVDYANKPGGSATYVEGGLNLVNIDGNSKVSWAHAWSGVSLADVGNVAVDWTNTGGATLASGPGLNVFVDFDGNGTLDGTLVGEPNVYGQDWWATGGTTLSNGAPDHGTPGPADEGGFGSERHGTINEWLALYPDAKVAPNFAFAFGTGGPASGILHSLTIGCTVFSFDYVEQAVAPEPESEQYIEYGEADCEAGTIPTTTYQRDTGEPTYDPQSNAWTQGAWGEWYVVDEGVIDASAEECPLPTEEPTPTPEPSDTSTPTVTASGLADTGSGPLLPLGIIASILIALGITVQSIRVARRNKA